MPFSGALFVKFTRRLDTKQRLALALKILAEASPFDPVWGHWSPGRTIPALLTPPDGEKKSFGVQCVAIFLPYATSFVTVVRPGRHTPPPLLSSALRPRPKDFYEINPTPRH